MVLGDDIQAWAILIVTGAMLISLAWERVGLEITALTVTVFLLLWFQLFPLETQPDRLSPEVLLSGFANPALLTVMALLVMGQALIQTGGLSTLSDLVGRLAARRKHLAVGTSLTVVSAASAVLNNTPVVVIFISIMQSLAVRLHTSPSRLMMPLSFAAILGGMTTLMGSSTNLLVNSALLSLGLEGLGFFDITLIGVCLASVGLLYVLFILPRLLPHRGGLARAIGENGRQFVAEIEVEPDSELIGEKPVAGRFPLLPKMTVQLVQRDRRTLYPPFDEITLRVGDVIVVAAPRAEIADALSHFRGRSTTRASEPHRGSTASEAQPVLAEVMVAPASRMADLAVSAIAFESRFDCTVLGVQRRGRMQRRRLGEIRLSAGDVLLVKGEEQAVRSNLSANPDVLLMSWAVRPVPKRERVPHATIIFLAAILTAALGILPIVVSALAGALAMLMTGCINIRQATRAMDRTIFLLVGASLALGQALQATGGAALVADGFTALLPEGSPILALGVLFLTVAVATNVLTNNATAILFTPIAVDLATGFGLSAFAGAVTVIMAANCSFATPIGYQTNLLVMGPGHYKFRDYLKGGLPLILLMMLTYLAVARILLL